MVKIYIVDETQGPIDQIWAEVAVGKKFLDAVGQQMEMRVMSQEVPENHLDPEVKAVVAKLGKGETSKIFKAQGVNVIVHLAERVVGKPVPFDRVKGSIKTQLVGEKVKELRNDYLKQIKSGTEIVVKEGPWKEVKEKLEARNGD